MALRRLARDTRGFTLIELLTVLAMLLIVMAALSSVLIAATKAEEDMNRRFGSQINTRIALDQLRREIHCATSVTPTGSSSSIVVVLGSRCPFGAGSTVRWCVHGTGSRFALYRSTGATCTTSDRRMVDYLTYQTAFAFSSQSTSSLAYLSVDLRVDTKPVAGLPSYRLTDDIVLRNSTRT